MNRLKTWFSKWREEDKELMEGLKNVDFEKRDVFALIISALITILPVVFITWGIFVLVIWLVFLR
jgi:hypothetical protein